MVKIKICGLTRPDDLLLAAELGADYPGLVFHPASPRFLTLPQARELARGPRGRARLVGVFVDSPLALVKEYQQELGLDIVQLHGRESPEYCAALALPLWKAFRPRAAVDLQDLPAYAMARAWLLDAHVEDVFGGSGRPLRTAWLPPLSALARPVWLAGGIGSENLENYWRLQPHGLDLSSGVESEPGKKERRKLEDLFGRLRQLQGG
jgi:phosphoribosylanthranilate isomerase